MKDYHININGLKMLHNSLTGPNINLIPLHPEKIKKIKYQNFESYKYPQKNSVLNINYEKPNYSGLSFYSFLGNETGDPGPYKYVSTKSSPNIDRIGENVLLNLFHDTNIFAFNFGFQFEEYSLTDLAMRKRIHSLTPSGWGGIDKIAANSTIKYENNNFSSEIRNYYNNTDKYFYFL